MNLREWWTLARPPTLPASVVPVAVGTAAAAASGSINLGAAAVMALVAVLLQIATNMANEYADFRRGLDAPDSVGIAGSLVHGRMEPGAVRGWALMSYGIAFILGLVLVVIRGPVMLVMGVAGILAGYFYNAGPRPLSATALGEAAVFLIMGPIEVAASEIAAGGRVTGAGIFASFTVGVMVAAILLANNIRDRVKDAEGGRHTLAIRLGPRRGGQMLSVLVVLGTLWPVAAAASGLLPLAAGLPVLVLPWGLGQIRRLQDGGLARGVLVMGRIHLVAGLLLAAGLALGRV